MLRTDLSTRPFYNERAVTLALGVVAVIVLVCTVLNVTALAALSRRQSTLAAEADQAERTARDLRQKAGPRDGVSTSRGSPRSRPRHTRQTR